VVSPAKGIALLSFYRARLHLFNDILLLSSSKDALDETDIYALNVNDGSIIWELRGVNIAPFLRSQYMLQCPFFSDMTTLYTFDKFDDDIIEIVDIASGEVIRSYSLPFSAHLAAIDKENHILYVEGNSMVLALLVEEGKTWAEKTTTMGELATEPKRNIFIAAGHGDEDPGAVYHGTTEAKEVIEIVDETMRYLNGQNFKQWNIVSVPHELKLKETIEWVNERASEKDVTVEIHLDAPSITAKGPLIIIANTKEAKETFTPLLEELAEVLGTPSRGFDWNENKIWPDGTVGFGLVNQCKTISAILEMDVLSNPERAEIIKASEADDIYALGLAKGILKMIGSEYLEYQSNIATALPAVGATSLPTALPTSTSEPTQVETPPPAYTGPSGIEMASIPGGTFSMGSDDSGYSNERPVHSVTLSPFNMSAYEITYAQWMKVKNWGESHGYSFNMQGLMGSGGYGPGKTNDNHPVTDIEWYDTVLWCNALSEMEGRTPCYYTSASQSDVYRSGRIDIENDWVKWGANGNRLPTEAEWEYACRAKTTTEYSFGDSIDSGDANFNYNENGTTQVGSYAPNNWGLYDMHGNVWEWCWDWYDSGYYNNSPSKNPVGPSAGSYRVYRGGSWINYAEYLRSAIRYYDFPGHISGLIGFRPVSSQ